MADELDSKEPLPNAASADLAVGSLFDGRFEIISVLGRGGMGVVYKAQQRNLDRVVALKIPHKYLLDHRFVLRFQNEAMVISRLSHPNIMGVYGFGLSDDQPYLVMECLEGLSLAALLRQEKLLEKTRALPIFAQICDALEHAHKNGIIHRDLKPSNVLLIGHDKSLVKLIDFGIAQCLADSGKNLQALTRTKNVYGTIAYASPEQCLGKALDTRTDIYSMGCLIYEALSGDPPFIGVTPFQTVSKQINSAPPPTQYLEGAFGAVVLQALEKDPALRPQSAAVLKQALLEPVEYAKKLKLATVSRPLSVPGEKNLRLTLILSAFFLVYLVCYANTQGQAKWESAIRKQDVLEISDLLADQFKSAAPGSTKEARAYELISELLRSKNLSTWKISKKVELFDALFQLLVSRNNRVLTLLAANKLFLELIEEGAEYDSKKLQPDSRWSERVNRVSEYLLKYENSTAAWYQLSFSLDSKRSERNRYLDKFMGPGPRLTYLELRAEAFIRQTREPVDNCFGRALDLLLYAAELSWDRKDYARYQRLMYRAEYVVSTFQLEGSCLLHKIRAREYLVAGQRKKFEDEMKKQRLAERLFNHPDTLPGVGSVIGKEIEDLNKLGR